MKKKKAKPLSAVLQDISLDIKHIIASLFRKPQVDCAKGKLFVCFSFCRFLFVYLLFFLRICKQVKDLGQARLMLFNFLNELSSGFMSLSGSENQIAKEEPRCGVLNER